MSIINDALKKVQKSRQMGFWHSKPKPVKDKEKSDIHQTISNADNDATITSPLPDYPEETGTRQQRENAFPAPSQGSSGPHSHAWLRVLEFGLIAICLMTTIFLLGLNFQMFNSNEKPPAPAPAAPQYDITAGAQHGIRIKGVMMMPEGNIALINDKTYRVGDTVKGMVITDITFDDVKFDNRGKTLKIRVQD